VPKTGDYAEKPLTKLHKEHIGEAGFCMEIPPPNPPSSPKEKFVVAEDLRKIPEGRPCAVCKVILFLCCFTESLSLQM
jgi:hypothetical protein